MALVTERIEGNVLYLELNGRIDSSNADQAEELIKKIRVEHPELNVIFDAENLEYLSSAERRTDEDDREGCVGLRSRRRTIDDCKIFRRPALT